MWFIWRPFDLAAVTSPGYIFNTRENSSKRQKSIKIWGLPLSKPGRGIGGVKRMFHHRRSESTVNWSCGIQQRAEQLCLIYTKPSSAEWLGDHFWDVLLLKADFLHGYEREWPWGAILHRQRGGPAPHWWAHECCGRVLASQSVSHSQNCGGLSSFHPTAIIRQSDYDSERQLPLGALGLHG